MIAGITNSEISIQRTFLGPEKKFARRRKKIRRHEEKKIKEFWGIFVRLFSVFGDIIQTLRDDINRLI